MGTIRPTPDGIVPANIVRFMTVMLPTTIVHDQGGITPC